MPFQSEKQRRFLHANHPEIAKRWEREYSNGTGSEGVLGIGEKNWLVDEEGNPIMLKEQPPEKNWTIDEEGNPIILEEPPREKHWIDAEEITTDDGNDIELTAYNAAFDDPNDLSTGVKSLFQAKDGGTPQLAKKSKDGKRPGYGGPHDSYDAGQSYSGSQNTGNQGSDKGHSRFEPGSGYYGEPVTTSAPKDDGGGSPNIGPSLHGGPEFKLTPEQKKTEINRILENKQAWDKDKWKRDALALVSAPTTLIGMIPFVISQNKKKNERIAQINEDLRRLEALGYEPHPWEEKDPGGGYGIKGDLEFEKFTLENPNWNKGPDDDDKGDGPDVVPITEEIEAYEDMAANPMSLLNMRDNKALYAALSEKWEKQRREKKQEYKDYGLLPDNAVDNTAVGAITMQANSGGLANLFRVKNQ